MKSKNKWKLLFFLAPGLLLLALGSIPSGSCAEESSPLEINVFFIPREDMHRAPGYTDDGLFLPLSELLSLAEKAAQSGEDFPESLPVSCTAIHLKGTLSQALGLEGILEYNAPSEGWSAVLVEESLFPWTSQEPQSDNPAFLARIKGKTYLYAKGPAKGALALKALFPVVFHHSQAAISLGSFYAPCRLDVELESNMEILPSDSVVLHKDGAEGNLYSIFLTTPKNTRIVIKRTIPFLGIPGMRVNIDRIVSVVGAGIRVKDTLVLEDEFSPKTALSINIPERLRFLRVVNHSSVIAEISSNTLVITPLEPLDVIHLDLIFSADMKGHSAILGKWNIPSLYVNSSMTIQSSDQYALLPSDFPLSLIPIEGAGNNLRYLCWDNLPEINLSLVRRIPSIPPVVNADLNIKRNEASAVYSVHILDKNILEMEFMTPLDWILTDLALKSGNRNIPFNLVQKDKTRWRVIWPGDLAPEVLQFTLHRTGSWGAPKSISEIEIPLVFFDGPRPYSYEMNVKRTEGLNIRPTRLTQLSVMTGEIDQTEQGQVSQIDFQMKAIGEKPAGALSIEGRDADVRAVVVTALTVGDDRTMVRALLNYQVRIAPARTFRFILPHGVGSDVRINAPEIREKSLRITPKGEEWTIVTQADILGKFEVILEWPLETLEQNQPILAPEIYILNVTSQEGFLILEGSETLQLTIKAKNLSEADLADLPALPWQSDKRTIAIYRYVEPPFTLEVLADKFQPEPLLKGIVKQASITTSFTPQGEEFTQAVYSLSPFSERQFFEIQLPEQAKTWSVRVNDRGVKPATRKASGGGELLMIPLPSSADQVSDVSIRILYNRKAEPLDQVTRLLLLGPVLSMPINRTVWNLNLPPGFEYLSFDIASQLKTTIHEPIITFLRKAYYPKKILFPQMPIVPIIVLTLIVVSLFFIIKQAVYYNKKKKTAIPPAVKKPAKPLKKVGCTFTIFEVLIVMAIIAILSAIAVPNFLEAQSRSKVSRVKADMRSMATGLEAYYVDNNDYPPNAELLWQGAVKYLSSPFADPFADYQGTPFKYVVGRSAIEKAIQAGYLPPDYPVTDNNEFWMIYSSGPDTMDDRGAVVYDPTNGTISVGDVIRIKDGGSPKHYAGYKKVREEERMELAREAIPQTAPMPTSAPSAPSDFMVAFDRDEAKPQAQVKPEPQTYSGYLWMGLEKQEVRFLAGLQSLSIEIPTGGVQRTMESLSKDPHMEIRFLERQKFLRLRFLSWIIPLILMVGVWIYKRSLYDRVFLIGTAVVLILPLLKSSSWTVFFNSAFLGILCSLSAPLVSRLMKRYLNSHLSPTAILLFLFAFLALNPNSNAQPTFETVDHNTIDLIVPYGTDQVPGSDNDPLTFISRENFTLLWKKAWKEPIAPSKIEPITARITLTGSLSPDGSHIQGTLAIYAVNANDIPSSLELKMKQVALQSFPLDSPQAFLESTPRGLVLQMDGHWMGEISAPFILPCEGRGSTGRFKIEFPESALGLWKIEFPYPRISTEAMSSAPFVQEQSPEGSALFGSIQPGLLEISWKGEIGEDAPVIPDREKNWRTTVESHFVWNSLSFADFTSIIKIEKKDISGSILEKVKLLKDPSLHILSAKGEDLLETRISDSEVELTLGKTGKTEITIEGFQIKPREIQGKDPLTVSWDATGLWVSDGIESRSVLFFDVSDQIEIVSVNTDRMERRPSRQLRPGYASQQYETIHSDWKARFVFKPYLPVFEAEIRELWAPMDGFLHRLSDITLIPRNSRITQCMLSLPEGLRVLKLSGNNILNWAQDDRTLLIAFHPGLESESTVQVFATSDLGEERDIVTITPLSVSQAAEIRRTSVVLVSPDQDFQDIDLAGAVSRAPDQTDQTLLQSIPLNIKKEAFGLRAYKLSSSKPLQFKVMPLEATALYTIFNQVTVSDGLQSLDAVLRVEPRRGRVRHISALLILSCPDPQAPARLRTLGPVRDVGTERVSDRIFRITADLSSPRSEPVDVRFQLDSPVNTENGREVCVSILAPEEATGARSLLLLRRTFEGELNLKDKLGVRIVDPAELRHPESGLIPLPSDQSFELSLKANSGPIFLIARHKRDEALRAVVEILRQRTIITQDGMERCELEIVLQNKSEQFLKIALPYPKSDVSIYEVQVASRPVKTTFAREDNRDVLMVPLIRTGLLEPELTVSVAYVVNNRKPFKGKGSREQKLPDILGGIPVAQSALILMMPSSLKYYDFKGSLNQVQLLDIEVDEALRQAKQVEKFSEAVLYTKGDKQRKLLDNLMLYKSKASSKIKYAQSTSEAYERRSGIAGKAAGRIEDKKEQELSQKRGASLQMAQQAEQIIGANVAQVSQMVQAQQAITPTQTQPSAQKEAAVPAKALTAPIVFPRTGDVFVFRQLQGTGFIRFKFSSRQSLERKKDFLLLLVVFILISFLIYSGSRIFSSRLRVAGLLLLFGFVSIFFGFALDLAVPVLGAALILYQTTKRNVSG